MKQNIKFLVISENNVVTHIGKSQIVQLNPNYKGSGTKWFDDRKLLKAGAK